MPGHVARDGADGDRAADAERRRRADRDGDQEADDRALDGKHDRIVGEARNVHRAATASRRVKRRGGETRRSCAATSCSSRSPIAWVASSTA